MKCIFLSWHTWMIQHNKENMELQLAKADSFYKLNNILVNKTKSEILIKECNKRTEESDENDSEMITFNFGNSEVKLSYPTQNQSARFLGV